MKKLLILILCLISFLARADEGVKFEGVIIAYDNPTALNAEIVYSVAWKGYYRASGETKLAYKIYKDWGKNTPWDKKYIYFINRKVEPIPLLASK